jgi:hypothetical protein
MGISRFELPGDGVLAAQVCLAQRMPAGDSVELRSAARRSAGWAGELRRVAAVLLASAEGPLWSGAAHRAFVEQLRARAPVISATADRYEHYAAADALDRCTRALSQADRGDPTRDVHGLAALGCRVGHTAAAIVSPLERVVLHPTLHNLSDCLSSLNTDLTVLGLGLLFICPPAGAACLAAATVLAAAQVGVDATRRAHGEQVSNGALGLELAAAIPLGGNAVRGLRAADNVSHLVTGGGLMAHEGLDAGHTLAKHVGKTEEFLRNRLATEPGIKAASTFYDRQSAESVLSGFIDANASEITRWLRDGSYELILQGHAARPVGLVIPRAATRPVEATGIRLVLRRSPKTGIGFRIHTAMVTR